MLEAEARIVKLGLLDLEGMKEPGSGPFVSLPDNGAGLNRLYLGLSRLPDPQSARDIVMMTGSPRRNTLAPTTRFLS